MGRRGPRPTPTAILKARGSWRAKANPDEPPAVPGAPPMPAWPKGDVRRDVWAAVVDQLARLRVLSRTDGNAIARYADALVRWHAAAQHLAEQGETYVVKDAKGNVRDVKAHPQAKVYTQLATLLLKLEQEFGLTPAGRARIKVEQGAGQSGPGAASGEQAEPEEPASIGDFNLRIAG